MSNVEGELAAGDITSEGEIIDLTDEHSKRGS